MDKPALNALPAEPFDLSQWSRARVNIDYHIAFDANYYSVPYHLVYDLVEVRSTPTTTEIFYKGQRVALICVRVAMDTRLPLPNTAHDPTRRIWNGRPRAWSIGRSLLVRTRPGYSNAF